MLLFDELPTMAARMMFARFNRMGLMRRSAIRGEGGLDDLPISL
jgi:hypothetical protein